jgi:hypothetical protein
MEEGDDAEQIEQDTSVVASGNSPYNGDASSFRAVLNKKRQRNFMNFSCSEALTL